MDLVKNLSESKYFVASLALGSGIVTSLVLSKIQQEQEQKKKQESQTVKRKEVKKQRTVLLNQIDTAIPKEIMNATNTLMEEVKNLESRTCNILKVPNLIIEVPQDEIPCYLSPLYGENNYREVFGGGGFLPDNAFVYTGSYVLSDAVIGKEQSLDQSKRYVRAGPRKHNYFDPSKVKAAIVTCGGLCPGLNVVIREIYMCLQYNYGVKEVYGIKYGYKGFYLYPWERLSDKDVKEIQRLGGTILGSSRGGFDKDKIVDSLIENGITHVYCLGGDGTHRGIRALYTEVKARKLNISVVGIPKTIDNDIPIIDKSFGFETSVEEAVKAIQSAYVEAHCAEYGVGLVRLMGRYAGFIAMEATNASRDAHVCLVPEFKFQLYGEDGVLEYVYKRLLAKRNCVVVVAEGAGEAVIDGNFSLTGEKDPSGNAKLGDIGDFLNKEIVAYGKKKGMEVTLKYINPTYMIRTVPANALDRKMCTQLAQNAVHGAMAGFTGFTVGHVNNRLCYIPLDEICKEGSGRRIKPEDRAWQRLLASTGQPSFRSKEAQQQ